MSDGCTGAPMTKQQAGDRPVCGRAAPPRTKKGDCEHSRETPFYTHDCYCDELMQRYEPLWYPGQVYIEKARCPFDNQRICPYFMEAK